MVGVTVDILVLGPGSSLLHHAEEIKCLSKKMKVLAFQGTFPHCVEYFDIIPDLWLSGDPNAYVEGFEYLKNSPSGCTKVEIIFPSFFSKDIFTYRKYCGSTPLLRKSGAWEAFKNLGARLREKGYNFKDIPCTSTKYIKTISTLPEFKEYKNLFGSNPFYRFMHDEVIFGSIEFDSESVIGDKFKWGLENKLSSVVFPICYKLGAKKLYIGGFDFKGPRFYSPDARHPWNDETQTKNNVVDFSLNIVKNWVQWQHIHGMEFHSVVHNDLSLLNSYL